MSIEMFYPQFQHQEEKYTAGPYHREYHPLHPAWILYKDALTRLRNNFPNGSIESCTILDHCGGDGAFASLAADYGADVYISDLSPKALPYAQAADSRLKLVQADSTIPFAPETFDAVVMLEALEHMPDDDFALENVNAVLKPDGVFVLSVPSAKNPVQNTHFRHYDFEVIEQKLADHQFELVNAIGYRDRSSKLTNRYARRISNGVFYGANTLLHTYTGTSLLYSPLPNADDFLLTAIKK